VAKIIYKHCTELPWALGMAVTFAKVETEILSQSAFKLAQSFGNDISTKFSPPGDQQRGIN